MTESNVYELDDYRSVEDLVKKRFGAKNVIFSLELPNGEILTYVPHEILDITLVYMLQTFQDRRTMRVNDINS